MALDIPATEDGQAVGHCSVVDSVAGSPSAGPALVAEAGPMKRKAAPGPGPVLSDRTNSVKAPDCSRGYHAGGPAMDSGGHATTSPGPRRGYSPKVPGDPPVDPTGGSGVVDLEAYPASCATQVRSA